MIGTDITKQAKDYYNTLTIEKFEKIMKDALQNVKVNSIRMIPYYIPPDIPIISSVDNKVQSIWAIYGGCII
jgi:hypothetical protein